MACISVGLEPCGTVQAQRSPLPCSFQRTPWSLALFPLPIGLVVTSLTPGSVSIAARSRSSGVRLTDAEHAAAGPSCKKGAGSSEGSAVMGGGDGGGVPRAASSAARCSAAHCSASAARVIVNGFFWRETELGTFRGTILDAIWFSQKFVC